MSGLFNDLRFGLRLLKTRPGFTAAAILTLMLGIGVNTAVFSVLNGYLLKPLPYPHSNRIVQIHEDQAKAGIRFASLSVPNYLSMVHETSAFSALAAFNSISLNLTTGGKRRGVKAIKTTASLFNVLQVHPFLGQAFARVNQQPGRGQVAVLSYGLWQHAFGGDPNAIGRTMRLDGKAYTVIGVMPKGFAFNDRSVELWVPYVFSAKDKAESHRRKNMLEVIARRKPGVSLAKANRQLQAALHHTATVSGSMRHALKAYDLRWWAASYHQLLVGHRASTLLLLQGAVLLVLLITCVNVANLLLSRILGRTHAPMASPAARSHPRLMLGTTSSAMAISTRLACRFCGAEASARKIRRPVSRLW
jgi:hypothetical protein